MKYVLRVRNCTEAFSCIITSGSDLDFNIASIHPSILGMFPFLASKNEFAVKPMKAPPNGFTTRDAYKGHTRSE
jgi:hypothetical protein